MYIGEYLLWFGNSIKKETRKKLEMSYSSSDMKLSEVEKDWTKESVSYWLLLALTTQAATKLHQTQLVATSVLDKILFNVISPPNS
ncbi:hypothetical protein [Gilliamella apicola]|uniref:hypothetical protein n=1 Tax=Gilliamella apicola TaxID=1196095 RepID=UPI000A32CF04|nr:hypothetical protein [Gilliamella apicola]OTQ27758.1 hypothetical protein B6D03_10460 [Gilliamella apicola]